MEQQTQFYSNACAGGEVPLVQTFGLTKSYGGLTALNQVTLNLEKGKVIGLLGPNGSGKTTLIKILAGLLTPTSGEARICGHLPGPESKAIVSYLPERPYFSSWMKAGECLTCFSDFYADFDRPLAEQMLADLQVPLDARMRTLSKGTREKIQLVVVMARRAQLYLLDEPIAGVDPVARDYILRTIISAYRKEATVLLSTHLIWDVESVLDQFLFLHQGNVVLGGDVRSVRQLQGKSLDEYFKEVFRCCGRC